MGIKESQLVDADDLKPKRSGNKMNHSDFSKNIDRMKKIVPFNIA